METYITDFQLSSFSYIGTHGYDFLPSLFAWLIFLSHKSCHLGVKFSNGMKYKINTQKLVFFSVHYEQFKKESKKIISFLIILKWIKFLRINLTKRFTLKSLIVYI